MHNCAILSFHKLICCAAGPIPSRCGLWPSIPPHASAPKICYVSLLVTYISSSVIPEKVVNLLHSTRGRSCIKQLLAVSLLSMCTIESYPKEHLAIEIKAGTACLVQNGGLDPFTHPAHALAAYSDAEGGRPFNRSCNRWPRWALKMCALAAAAQTLVVALATCPPPTTPSQPMQPAHRHM